ncbi:hypothetical protein ABEB36_014018 [Hypothenemus hampei]|uniref:Uncharacterized protein n=1 Tax=Hypothenemus hampei TaxID=57062 RepID=A0ABD1E3B0_HYPHA
MNEVKSDNTIDHLKSADIMKMDIELEDAVYCSFWHEGIVGRDGVHLANGLIKILEALLKDIRTVKNIILWSDSCVPQNKNSFMSVALQNFLNSTPIVQTIEPKFSEPIFKKLIRHTA